MTPPDAKPDPLEALRVLASPQAYTETPSPFQAHTQQVCAAAIAAWEKEQAGWSIIRDDLVRMARIHNILRAAVQKVRDELRKQAADEYEKEHYDSAASTNDMQAWADALDAALGGKQ